MIEVHIKMRNVKKKTKLIQAENPEGVEKRAQQTNLKSINSVGV